MQLHVILRWCTLVVITGGLVSCQLPNRYLMYPQEVPPRVQAWAEDVDTGALRLHLEWARPAGAGPFPTVLVHPDGSATAADMRGVIWDLASRGYLAVAADYRRLREGTYRRTLLPWCNDADVTQVLEVLRTQPLVDPQRLAALGFSQGGIFSLLIAAHAPDIKAVVAYYPVTDFPQWLAAPRANLMKRFVFHMIREYFRREAESCTEEPWQTVLQKASPLYQAERIQAPVLLLHGDEDGAAPVDESRRLAARLSALGRDVELVVIAGGRHVFNFKHPAQAQYAWQVALQWLARHLGTTSVSQPSTDTHAEKRHASAVCKDEPDGPA
ncbi:MAG: alpha/beta fold hydrolase [Nitrospirae bacterium]|nr:alpha/beta fold hydrolase [Nitrospirota bacterium]